MTKRINFLDGFRGVAILLVIFYHAYATRPKIVPYGERFSSLFPFKQGFLGVQLFFLISGFVILMSLEKSDNFLQFIYKRWIRLFPAMLIGTIVIYFTATFLPERPLGLPELKNVVSGLIFMEPEWIKKISGFDVGLLEGTFWSLYVEVKFYIIIGILYFYFGSRRAVLFISGLYIIWFAINVLEQVASLDLNYITLIFNTLSISNFGWFASGAMAYLYYKNKYGIDLLYSIILGLIAASVYYRDIFTLGFVILLLLLFISTICFEKTRQIFDNKFFMFFGFISYPLYLIHENAMIALIVKSGRYFTIFPQIFLPIIPIAVLTLISYLIAKIFEPFLRKLIDKSLELLIEKKGIFTQAPYGKE